MRAWRSGAVMPANLNLFFPCWRRLLRSMVTRRVEDAPSFPSAPCGPRQLRGGEMLRHALAEILRENDIRDPELDGVSVTITQVKPSPDMRYATVYCAPLGGKNTGPIIAALNRHKGFLRGQMGHMISIKFTPDLRFVEDQSFAEAEKIENLLKC